ncbi:MAG TPA: glycosyltransferase family 2 protein, partial [Stellaceae bacterium]|nr:glycosyltransferase family 2 protein [Stellaceae bacterium]
MADSPAYIGYVDGLHGGALAGWCMARDRSPRRVSVRVFEGAELLGETTADLYRADVLPLGGDGYHGFSFPLPPQLSDGELHALTVRVGPTGEVLPGSPAEMRLMPLDLSYEGELEGVVEGKAVGWAQNWQLADEDPVVDILAEGHIVASGRAYVVAGEETRRFALPLPEFLLDGKEHLLTATVGPRQATLAGSPLRFRLRVVADEIDFASARRRLDANLTAIEGVETRLHEIAGLARRSAQFNQLAADTLQDIRRMLGGFDHKLAEIGALIDALRVDEIALPPLLLEQLEAAAADLAQTAGEVGMIGRLAQPEPPVPLLDEVTRRFPPLEFARPAAPRVSIVIPVHNKFFYTYQCLASLLRHPPHAPVEIVLVDDASTDETVLAPHLLPGVTVVRNAANAGFLDSCNRGAAAAAGAYLMFLNNDTTLHADAVDELLGSFDRPGVGLVGAKLVFPDGRLQEAGGIVFRDGGAINYGRGDDHAKGEYNYVRPVDYCSGAAIMLPKAVWNEVGGFDERYRPAYYEDADLAFKVRAAGLAVCYQPFAVVTHFEGISSGTDPRRGVKAYQARNAKLFAEKWSGVLAAHRPKGEGTARERDRGVSRRVLVIDACTPTPDQDAGSTVTFEHMRVLQSLGFKVTFIPETNFAFVPDYTTALQRLGIEAVYAPSYHRMDKFLAERGEEFDLIYVHRFSVAERCLPLLRKYARAAPILFNTQDLHYLREERAAALSGAAADLAGAAETKARELAVIGAVDGTMLCSTAEVALVERELPDSFLYYFPWLIKAETLLRPAFAEREGFMFLGGFGHPPNADAVAYFVRD